MPKFGLIVDVIKPEDYIFGSGQLEGIVLQPTGQWEDFLPIDEYQNLFGVEPFACAAFGTNNCIETLERRLFTFNDNWSDRYLAKVTGTDLKHGNSPQIVAERIRHNGLVDQTSWDFTSDINTFEKFYATPPSILTIYAQHFLDNYDFKHDYVPNDPESMKKALTFSPLGMTVYGWKDRGDGIMEAGNGRDNHFVMCYGYVEEQYWKVFDSYDNSRKNVEWKHRPVQVKRYSLGITPKTISWFEKALKIISDFLTKMPPTPPVVPQEPPKPIPPATTGLFWNNSANVRHSVRVMCDEAGLTHYQKEIITACIKQESNFNPKAIGTININGTRDYGLCQYNNGKNKYGQAYWIGVNAPFASIEEVLNNPEKNVTVMLKQFKAGNLKLWSSFVTGAYLKWMPVGATRQAWELEMGEMQGKTH